MVTNISLNPYSHGTHSLSAESSREVAVSKEGEVAGRHERLNEVFPARELADSQATESPIGSDPRDCNMHEA